MKLPVLSHIHISVTAHLSVLPHGQVGQVYDLEVSETKEPASSKIMHFLRKLEAISEGFYFSIGYKEY